LLLAIPAVTFTSLALHLSRGGNAAGLGSSAILRPGMRSWHIENLRPFEELLVRWRVRPSFLSYAQLLVGMLVGWAYANGLIFAGGWLVLCAGSLDILDGRVARRTSSVAMATHSEANIGSRRGAFLDSVIDRYADSFAFLGLAVFFSDTWMLWAVLLGLVGSLMVSYTRARAEGLGVPCFVGFIQRAERYVLLGVGSVYGSLVEHVTGWRVFGHPYGLVVLVVIALAVLSNLTAIQRAVHVLARLQEQDG